MFQFPPSASLSYFTHLVIARCYSNRISPFGHTRVNALLAAHRALSWPFRPSSPACPKASISCPESLIITYFCCKAWLHFRFTRTKPQSCSPCPSKAFALPSLVLFIFAYSQIAKVSFQSTLRLLANLLDSAKRTRFT